MEAPLIEATAFDVHRLTTSKPAVGAPLTPLEYDHHRLRVHFDSIVVQGVATGDRYDPFHLPIQDPLFQKLTQVIEEFYGGKEIDVSFYWEGADVNFPRPLPSKEWERFCPKPFPSFPVSLLPSFYQSVRLGLHQVELVLQAGIEERVGETILRWIVESVIEKGFIPAPIRDYVESLGDLLHAVDYEAILVPPDSRLVTQPINYEGAEMTEPWLFPFSFPVTWETVVLPGVTKLTLVVKTGEAFGYDRSAWVPDHFPLLPSQLSFTISNPGGITLTNLVEAYFRLYPGRIIGGSHYPRFTVLEDRGSEVVLHLSIKS